MGRTFDVIRGAQNKPFTISPETVGTNMPINGIGEKINQTDKKSSTVH
jgi:hypothetical protein